MRFIFFTIFSSIIIFSTKEDYIFQKNTANHNTQNQDIVQTRDTCILQGFMFEIELSTAPNPLKANIKNGRIHIYDLNGNIKNYRVIRYVFSDHKDLETSSVRSYGNLVSYPILQILKDSKMNDYFYFEEIIVVNENKEILNNEIRPIIIKRVSN